MPRTPKPAREIVGRLDDLGWVYTEDGQVTLEEPEPFEMSLSFDPGEAVKLGALLIAAGVKLGAKP